MPDRSILELMHAALDGVATAAEQARLKKVLERDPDAARIYEQLRATAQRLSEVREVEPPASLRVRIMHALPPVAASKARKSPVVLLSGALWHRPAVRYAYVFGGGLVLGGVAMFLYFTSIRGGEVSLSEVAGTLLKPESTREISSGPTAEIRSEFATAMMTARYSGNLGIVSVHVTPQRPVRVRFAFAPGTFAVSGVVNEGNDGGDLAVKGNTVDIHAVTEGKFTVIVRREPGAAVRADVGLYAGDSLLAGGTLQVVPAGQ